MPGNMPDDAPPEPPSHEPPSQRQRVTRLLIVLLLLGVLVLVIVDQVLTPCKVSEAASQKSTLPVQRAAESPEITRGHTSGHQRAAQCAERARVARARRIVSLVITRPRWGSRS